MISDEAEKILCNSPIILFLVLIGFLFKDCLATIVRLQISFLIGFWNKSIRLPGVVRNDEFITAVYNSYLEFSTSHIS